MPKAKNPGDFTTAHPSPEDKLAQIAEAAAAVAALPLVEDLSGAEEGEYRTVVDGKVRPVKLVKAGAFCHIQYLD